MVLATQINNKAEHHAALARIHELMGSEAGTQESEELRHLGEIVCEYEFRTLSFLQVPTDGVDALEFELDRGKATLDEVLSVFGGEDTFAAYMMRERDIDEDVAQGLADLLGLPVGDFTKPLRQNAPYGDILGGGLAWHHALEAMVARRDAAVAN